MPAKSKKQQRAAGAALAAKRGETQKSQLKGASKSMEQSMSEEPLEGLAKTQTRNLPEKKES
jgi:hypothetical protein